MTLSNLPRVHTPGFMSLQKVITVKTLFLSSFVLSLNFLCTQTRPGACLSQSLSVLQISFSPGVKANKIISNQLMANQTLKKCFVSIELYEISK